MEGGEAEGIEICPGASMGRSQLLMEWARARAPEDDFGIAVPSAKEEEQVRGGEECWSGDPGGYFQVHP